MLKLSSTTSALVGQPMFQLLQKAIDMEKCGKHMIHFELGDTNFDTPQDIKIAAINAINRNNTHYVPSSGIAKLKEAAAFVTKRSRGFTPTEGQMLVTPGANMQIYLALSCTCNKGDRVLLPIPYFPSYVAQTKALELNEVFTFPDDMLNKSATIINSPNNPTSHVYPKRKIEKMLRMARFWDYAVISDEVYSRLIYDDNKFFSPSMIDHCKERTIVINGFSKSFAMPGWRLGVVIGPEHIIAKMSILLETILSCVPPFIQEAGVAALLGDQKELIKMKEELVKRRNIMTIGLNSLNRVKCDLPQGGLYCWANIEKTGMSGTEYAEKALLKGVVLCPGAYFGDDRFIRLCFGGDIKSINEGIKRLRSIK